MSFTRVLLVLHTNNCYGTTLNGTRGRTRHMFLKLFNRTMTTIYTTFTFGVTYFIGH